MEPEKIWRAFLNVSEKLKDHLDKVELVVQSVLSPSLIPMDASGYPLYPSIIHWDRRSVKQEKKHSL
jgi:sugar (pentulose or hexulose) kinase